MLKTSGSQPGKNFSKVGNSKRLGKEFPHYRLYKLRNNIFSILWHLMEHLFQDFCMHLLNLAVSQCDVINVVMHTGELKDLKSRSIWGGRALKMSLCTVLFKWTILLNLRKFFVDY